MLELAVDGVRAWEVLHDPDLCGRLGMVEFRRLLLRAGYQVEAVRQAALRHGWDRLSAGEML